MKKYIFTLMLFLILSSGASADPVFFKNLDKHPKSKQIEILEKRISFFAGRNITKDLQKTLDSYFKKNNLKAAVAFTAKQARESKDKKVRQVFINYIRNDKVFDKIEAEDFLDLLPTFTSIKDKEFTSQAYARANGFMSMDRLPSILKNKSEIKKMLIETGRREKTMVWHSLKFTLQLNYLDEFGKIANAKKDVISKEPVMKLDKCHWLAAKGNYSQAKTCYNSENTPVYKFFRAYLAKLAENKKPTDPKVFDEAAKFAKQRKNVPFHGFVEVMRVSLTESKAGVQLEPFVGLKGDKNPMMILMALRTHAKIPFLNAKIKSDLENQLKLTQKGNWYYNVYTSSKRESLVKSVFPQRSFYSQLLL